MRFIKKNDTVSVLAGKDKGKTGKVLRVLPAKNKAIVQGVNYMKKHKRQTKQGEEAGIIQMERPLDCSNLAVVCPRCSQNTRIGIDKLKDGSKIRFCKKCREVV